MAENVKGRYKNMSTEDEIKELRKEPKKATTKKYNYEPIVYSGGNYIGNFILPVIKSYFIPLLNYTLEILNNRVKRFPNGLEIAI